jgi:hypothetical protein
MSSNLLKFAIQRGADVVQVEVVSVLSGHQPKPNPERAAYVAEGAFDLYAGVKSGQLSEKRELTWAATPRKPRNMKAAIMTAGMVTQPR